MANYVQFSVGILGNAASLLLYGAPLITFRRVIKKRSTEDFSGFPYAIALLNCLLYTWYGSPLICNGFENVLVLTVNGVGIILELLFVIIYLKFAPRQSKLAMGTILLGVMTVFASIATASQLALHDHKSRKTLVGTSGMIVTVVMYASPLSIICPNIVGLPLGISQIVLYCMYRKQPIHDEQKVLDRLDPAVGLKEIPISDENNSNSEQNVEMRTKLREDKPRSG